MIKSKYSRWVKKDIGYWMHYTNGRHDATIFSNVYADTYMWLNYILAVNGITGNLSKAKRLATKW